MPRTVSNSSHDYDSSDLENDDANSIEHTKLEMAKEIEKLKNHQM